MTPHLMVGRRVRGVPGCPSGTRRPRSQGWSQRRQEPPPPPRCGGGADALARSPAVGSRPYDTHDRRGVAPGERTVAAPAVLPAEGRVGRRGSPTGRLIFPRSAERVGLVASRQDVLEASSGCITKDVLEASALERAPFKRGPGGEFTSFPGEGLSFVSLSSRA